MVGDHDLVVWRQGHGGQGQGEARGRIGHHGQALDVGADEGGYRAAGVRETLHQESSVEAVGVGLDLDPQSLLGFLDGPRHRAERAVVEMGDAPVE